MSTKTAPHQSASHWTPDEVAEAVEGVSIATSSRLWELMHHADEKVECEWPELTEEHESVVRCWPYLTEAERVEINAALVRAAR